MAPAEMRGYCALEDAGKGLLRAAMQQLHLSARAYGEIPRSSLGRTHSVPLSHSTGMARILKLARTMAGLAGQETIETAHLAEARQYRPRCASSWSRPDGNGLFASLATG